MQRIAIKRACKARGIKIDRWYEEKASSVNERPELRRLRKHARAGEISKLYVFRLDRLSRGGILEVLNIVHELRDHGCGLETVSDGFSFDGPATDVILAVFAWVAEMERAAIRERLAHARIELEAAGGHWGRPRKVDDPTARKIRKLAYEGRTVRSIAMALKIPRSTVAPYASGKNPPRRVPKSSKESPLQASRK
jgi:DNA invertase Pin-like site-specific DNA recombinase